jgi:hypothetical protein
MTHSATQTQKSNTAFNLAGKSQALFIYDSFQYVQVLTSFQVFRLQLCMGS